VRGVLLAFALATAACACSPPPAPPDSGLPGIPFAGRDAVARVEVAATTEERERGLMFRDVLPPDQGMLFAYPEDRPLAFWMKNCRSPLAAAFMDREGRILNIVEMAPAAGEADEDLPRYASKGDARYVLEMEAGWFARKGVRAGDRADLGAALRGVVAK